jgi:alkanesulfonate monooxygenase
VSGLLLGKGSSSSDNRSGTCGSMLSFRASGLRVFTTCQQSIRSSPEAYLDQVAEIARWSDEVGCEGILIYTDNGLVDPWLVAQIVLANTETLCPLIAVQPVYMHPYTAAKMVASFGFLHQRRIWLNMVAGGFRLDLKALADETPHDDRYERLIEYGLIIKALLAGSEPLTFAGDYYTVRNLKMTPKLPPELFPGITVSGSSPAGLKAARALKATAVKYPRRARDEAEDAPGEPVDLGMRCGVIARDTDEEAWDVALARFPEDRKGQLTHAVAMRVSDSLWHRQLSELGKDERFEEAIYWLGPFENYKTFCPYLVGSYERVGRELGRYLALGFESFIIDIPFSREELDHIVIAFVHAAESAHDAPTAPGLRQASS